jgi:hypothetical protein
MPRIKDMEDNIEICLKCGMLYDLRKECEACKVFESRIS